MSGSMPCGTFISSTMMVMMTAITPSLNASSLPLCTRGIMPCARSARSPIEQCVRERRRRDQDEQQESHPGRKMGEEREGHEQQRGAHRHDDLREATAQFQQCVERLGDL